MNRLLVAAVTFLTGVLVGPGPLVFAQSSKNETGMEFVKIPSGEFMMGCSQGDSNCKNDERPSHRVRITKAFEMGKYEVTQAEWKAIMGTEPSGAKGTNRPVENVTRDEALNFMNRLNAMNDGFRYRLPTEAEWEYAARAGTTGPYYGKLEEIGWFAENAEDETHPVGQKKPNPWGLYDMIGNVREWVADTYSGNYYNQSPQDDPPGPAAGQRGGGGGGRGGAGAPGGGGPGGGGGRGGPGGGGQGGGGRGGPGGGGGRGGPGGGGRGGGVAQNNDISEAVFVTVAQQRGGRGGQGGGQGGGGGRGGPGGGGRGGPGGGQGGGQAGGGRGGQGGQAGGAGGRGGGGGGLPIMRGGAWDNPQSFVRVTDRYHYYGSTLRTSDLGFRVVREAIGR